MSLLFGKAIGEFLREEVRAGRQLLAQPEGPAETSKMEGEGRETGE